MRADTASRIRLPEDCYLEHVRREVRLGRHFGPADFERAFRSFQQLYQVRPLRVFCSPDVLDRYCEIYQREGEAHRREVQFDGVPVSAAIMAPGTIAFEGEVDQDRMGDW